MKYYILEIFVNGVLESREYFNTDSESQAVKYSAYKEQSLRELKLGNNEIIITSEYKEIIFTHITDKEIGNLEEKLINISTTRGILIEYLRSLHSWILIIIIILVKNIKYFIIMKTYQMVENRIEFVILREPVIVHWTYYPGRLVHDRVLHDLR